MVFRKPYAFLIKNFKLVHFVLTGLMIFFAFRTNHIAGFIKDYIKNIANTGVATTYVGVLSFLSAILIIGISVILYILMRTKNKPRLLYLINSIVYFVFFIVLFYVLFNFKTIENDVLDPKTIRILRDIVNMTLYIQYPMIVVMIVRSLGFDIKRFDFGTDIEQMNIDVTDNEEVELVIGINKDEIARKGRRQLREFKYYVLENKVFVTVILGVIGGITLISLLLNITINKVYKEGQSFKTEYFTMNILDSYITDESSDGTYIGYNDTSYVIIKFKVKALFDIGIKLKLDPNDFLLKVSGNTYIPTLKYNQYFDDFGVGYKNQVLTMDKEDTYIFVYNIPNKFINKSKTIIYEEGYEYTPKDIIVKTTKVRIKPDNLKETVLKSTNQINSEIEFKDTFITGKFKVESYELADKFVYTYNYCLEGKCNKIDKNIYKGYKKTLLKLSVVNNVDDYNNSDFAKKFIDVKYKIGVKEYDAEAINKTPDSASSSIYLDVNKEILSADNIWLEINIRNNQYKYILK